MAAAASRGAAVGGSNPSGDGGGPKLQSPPGKGNKPAALSDITNTGKPNTSRSISGADIIKENVRLSHLLREKIKIIELSKIEIRKLHLALQASRQQNLQLAQANSQMLTELNTGKDRLKELQHELSCTAALLKVKDSEIERNNKTANQRRKEVNSQDVLNTIPSKVSAAVAHRIDGSIISAVVETQLPSNTGCQEPPQHAAKKRYKRKSESSGCVKDTNIVQDDYKPNLQLIMSLYHDDTRKPQRRRSSRRNQGSCEIIKVSDKTLLKNTEVSPAPSTLSVQKRDGPTIRKDMGKPLQNECNAVVNEVVMTSEFEEIEIEEQPSQEVNLKEIQEACSSVAAVESHQIGDEACNAKLSRLAESQASVQYNIIGPHKPPEDTIIKRKPQPRSSRLNQGSCEINEVSDKTLLENTEVSSAPSTLSVQKQHGPTIGKDKGKSLQNECNAVVNEVAMASEFEEIEIDEQPSQEANLKIQEACSSGAAVESHQIGDDARNAKQSYLAESQAVAQSNIIEPHKPPEDTIIKRDSNEQKLALYERESYIEDIGAKSDTSTSGALHHEKTKCQRRKSSRLNPAPSEDMKSTFETLKEDVVAPLAPSSSNASMEQRAALKQNDACSSMKSTEGHVPGRRSLRRAAEKVVSYKEIPLNVKMRRP